MVSPESIRIGNVYNRKHGKGWTWTVITEEIMRKIFTPDPDPCGYVDRYSLDVLEGIPVSGEVLDAFGFEKSFENDVYASYWRNGVSVLFGKGVNTKNDFEFVIETEFIINKKIFFIHEIQNIFSAVVGVEVKMKE